MKKTLRFLFTLQVAICNLQFAISQTYCGSASYDTEVFSNVTTTSDIVYGSNKDLNNNTVSLKMDIYQPIGDTAVMRPLIIFAHGGSFTTGSKTDAEQVILCTRFAKRGYVTASINYRLGIGFPINQASAQKATWRAVQDMKAAVRYFRKDAGSTNNYKVDSTTIFAGGFSAGAFMAVHLAYMDQSSEVPSGIDTVALGGLEGNSGNPGYSSAVKAIINLAGAVGDSSWIKPGDEPMVSAQGNLDNTVPYCTNTIYLGIYPIMVVSGSGSMYIRCKHIGLTNPLHTYHGQDHDAPAAAANMDSTIILASDFLYAQLGCTPTNTTSYSNGQTCVPEVGMGEMILPDENIHVIPNPSNGIFQVSSVLFNISSLEIYNVLGENVYQLLANGHWQLATLPVTNAQMTNDLMTIDLSSLPIGIYLLKIMSDENRFFETKIVVVD